MSENADLEAFDAFQRRTFQTGLMLWGAAVVVALAVYRDFSPVLGGLVIGGAASLGAFRYRVWALKRLATNPTSRRAALHPWLAGAGRYGILIAALAIAVWLAMIEDSPGYLIATAAALFVANVATIIQAVREARAS